MDVARRLFSLFFVLFFFSFALCSAAVRSRTFFFYRRPNGVSPIEVATRCLKSDTSPAFLFCFVFLFCFLLVVFFCCFLFLMRSFFFSSRSISFPVLVLAVVLFLFLFLFFFHFLFFFAYFRRNYFRRTTAVPGADSIDSGDDRSITRRQIVTSLLFCFFVFVCFFLLFLFFSFSLFPRDLVKL